MTIEDLSTLLMKEFGERLPVLAEALLILVVGWVVALVAAAATRGILRRTQLDDRLAKAISPGEEGVRIDFERWTSRSVYYLILLFTLVAFFQRLELDAVTGPINTFLDQVFGFIPEVVGAGLILLLAWITASVARYVVQRAGHLYNLDERLVEEAALKDQPVSVASSLGTAAYWLTLLFFLPAVLSALKIQGLVEPVQTMVGTVLDAIPAMLYAGIVLIVGWILARILREASAGLLVTAGADRFGARVGFDPQEGQSLSWAIGTIVYAVAIISVLIVALERLGLQPISEPATRMLDTILNTIPPLFGAGLLLVIAYLIGRLVAGLTSSVLAGVGFDSLPGRLGIQGVPAEGQQRPSQIAGYVILVAIVLFAALPATELLGFTDLTVLLREFVVFAANAFVALLIFAVGLYVANIAHSALLSAMGDEGRLWALLARVAIIVFVATMALDQMNIGEDIVRMAFLLVFGTVALALGLGAGLAIGLGSRDFAGREVERKFKSLFGSPSDTP